MPNTLSDGIRGLIKLFMKQSSENIHSTELTRPLIRVPKDRLIFLDNLARYSELLCKALRVSVLNFKVVTFLRLQFLILSTYSCAFIFQEDSQKLENMVDNSRNHNLSIWFGHYPLSTVSGHFSYGRNLLK